MAAFGFLVPFGAIVPLIFELILWCRFAYTVVPFWIHYGVILAVNNAKIVSIWGGGSEFDFGNPWAPSEVQNN